MKLNRRALAVSIFLCLSVAVLEGFLGSEGAQRWYAGLTMPAWALPLWASICVALTVYVIDGFIAYRLCTVKIASGNRVIGLTSLAVVMLFNALWTYAFFETQSPLVGFLGILAFIAPLVVLQVALFVYDRTAAWVHLPYVLFVVLYDVPLFLMIYRLNSDDP